MFLVLGNAAVDESMAVTAWPRPGETVAVGSPARDLGGKGVNQALMLARAGAAVRLVAPVGDDAEGAFLRAALAAAGLETAGLVTVAAPTDRSLIFVAESGENAIASTTAAALSIDAGRARAALAGLGPGDWLLLQGNLSLAATGAALEAARSAGVLTMLNPSPLQSAFSDLLSLVDILVLNESEGRALGGEGEPDVIAERLAGRGAATIVLTLGSRGALLRTAGTQSMIPAIAVPVVDTTGAGDCFTGVMLAALDRGFPIDVAVQAATRASALAVQRKGTVASFPAAAEIEAIFATL